MDRKLYYTYQLHGSYEKVSYKIQIQILFYLILLMVQKTQGQPPAIYEKTIYLYKKNGDKSPGLN